MMSEGIFRRNFMKIRARANEWYAYQFVFLVSVFTTDLYVEIPLSLYSLRYFFRYYGFFFLFIKKWASHLFQRAVNMKLFWYFTCTLSLLHELAKLVYSKKIIYDILWNACNACRKF